MQQSVLGMRHILELIQLQWQEQQQSDMQRKHHKQPLILITLQQHWQR